MAKVIYSFEGKQTEINCNINDKLKDINRRYIIKEKMDINEIEFFCHNNIVNDELTFYQLANQRDKLKNSITILVKKKRVNKIKSNFINLNKEKKSNNNLYLQENKKTSNEHIALNKFATKESKILQVKNVKLNKIIKDIPKINSKNLEKEKNKKIKKSESKKDNIEKEIQIINNLCYNKKRHKSEIKNFILKQKKEFKENKIKKKNLVLKSMDKLIQNIKNLEKNINNKNTNRHIKKMIEKKEDDENKDTIDNNNFRNTYYIGCLNVRQILSKND